MFLSQDKVQIPGAIYLSIKFDSQCNTEEGCDELLMSSSSDFQQDRHSFSGSPQKWNDFELPGEYKLVLKCKSSIAEIWYSRGKLPKYDS